MLSQSCPTLRNCMDCGPPGSSIHGILQARILEWVAMPSTRGSSRPEEQTCVSYVPCTGRQVLCYLGSLIYICSGSSSGVSHSAILTLCDPLNCSPPGSSVHGILQARVREWVAIPFSRGSSQPRDQIWVSRIARRFFTI